MTEWRFFLSKFVSPEVSDQLPIGLRWKMRLSVMLRVSGHQQWRPSMKGGQWRTGEDVKVKGCKICVLTWIEKAWTDSVGHHFKWKLLLNIKKNTFYIVFVVQFIMASAWHRQFIMAGCKIALRSAIFLQELSVSSAQNAVAPWTIS